MTTKTRWALVCFVLTFFVKFAAIFAGFAGMRVLAIWLFGLAFVSVFTAAGLCISDMLGDSTDKPMKFKEWGPEVPGMTQVKPGLYVPNNL